MAFSNEDKAAWLDSEVMVELEKFADEVLSGPPKEAFKPLETGEENWEEERFEDALEEFEKPSAEVLEENSLPKDLRVAYNIAIINGLQKLASSFAEKSNIKVAYRIEQTVCELKDCIGRKI